MAKDMLNAVLEAENECKLRVSDAKSRADMKITDAKKQAQKMIETAVANAQDNAQKAFDKVNSDAAIELKAAAALADEKCSRISQTAEKNRTKVIKNAVDFLIG